MNKQEIYKYLKDNHINHKTFEHEAVYTMPELDNVYLPYLENIAKNLFVRDDKKHNYYLITVKGDKRVDLKEFRKKHDLRSLSFASLDDLINILSLSPGSLTSFGLLNDIEHKVTLYLYMAFKDTIIGIHPNDNTATVYLNTQDLINIIETHGNKVIMIEI